METEVSLLWLRDRDSNTKFFHKSTILRQRQNRITNIVDSNGIQVEDEEDIRRILNQHLQQRWQSQNDIEEMDLPLRFPKVSSIQNEFLTRAVTKEEIEEVLRDMPAEKAPGPDGFQALFFQNFWHIIRWKVIQAIKYIFNQTQ